jgi:RNA polymerase sigma-70 factor (ECF subfamily)
MQNSDSQKQAYFVDLIARAKAGDNEAFEQLYEEYFTALYRYILIRVGNPDDADDIVQLVFLKFYKNLQNWQDQGYQPSAYLYSIARSVIADHFRTSARTGKKITDSEEFLAMVADKSQTPHSDVLYNEEIAQLYSTIQNLAQNYQEVLLLRYMQSLSSQEIANIIGKSDVATRKLLSRATKALSEQMQIDKEQND